MNRIKKAIIQAWSSFLFWKWDREYHAAVRRMRGCSHVNTMTVDVGIRCEKCRDCWALLMPALDGSERLDWTPNCVFPKETK